MNVKFELTKNQILNITKSLNMSIWLYALDWTKAFQALSKFAFANTDNIVTDFSEMSDFQNLLYRADEYGPLELGIDTEFQTALENLELAFEAAYSEETFEPDNVPYTYEMEFDFNSLQVLEESLDLIIRLSLGQWDNLGTVLNKITDKRGKHVYLTYFCNEPFVKMYRNHFISAFNPISGAESFGIHSKEISENVRSIYEVYKALMFEWKPYGVYDTVPKKIAKDNEPLPCIEFPLPYILTYYGDFEEAVLKIEQDDYPYKVRKVMVCDDDPDTIYLPIEDEYYRAYRLLQVGDRVYRKLNGYYVVVSRDEDNFDD